MLNCDYIIKTYVSVCNRALVLNKDRFPFGEILRAARQSESGKKIEVDIAGVNAASSYIFTIENNQISLGLHDSCDDCQCVRKWQIDISYLEAVVNEPDLYVKNPAMLNWEWMYDVESLSH